MKTPYIGFGNDTLEKFPPAKKGDKIKCPHCGRRHTLECALCDGKESDTLLFYTCGKDSYLASIAGKNIIGQKADCCGEI